jgi:MFS family permease
MLYFLDRVGRVKPMIIGALGCGICLLINAVLSQIYQGGQTENQNALRAQVAMNFCIQMFFVPLGVISWVYPSEIFPTEIRAKGNATATFINWTTGLLFAQVSPIALGNIGFKYFYVFFAFDMIAAVCFATLYPETKGRTLEQMDELFGDQTIAHALKDPEGISGLIIVIKSVPPSRNWQTISVRVQERVQ